MAKAPSTCSDVVSGGTFDFASEDHCVTSHFEQLSLFVLVFFINKKNRRYF